MSFATDLMRGEGRVLHLPEYPAHYYDFLAEFGLDYVMESRMEEAA